MKIATISPLPSTSPARLQGAELLLQVLTIASISVQACDAHLEMKGKYSGG
jgi:hypothetical protein